MNEDLIDNSAEAKLKRLIISYKEYDNKRKKYYSDKLKELGKLQSIIQELEDSNKINNISQLIEENKILRKQIKELKKELDIIRIAFNKEELYSYRNLSNKDRKLLIRISELEKSIDNYKKRLSRSEKSKQEWIQQVIKIKNEKL